MQSKVKLELQCDLRRDSCGQCVRADIPCSGYRDTQQLRISNESASVARKVLGTPSRYKPHSLPLSIDLQARDAFFAHYVASRCWEFLYPYRHPTDSPKHLTLSIEAVSLAYLWHQVYSDAALATAREKYITALRLTNKSLRSPNEATKATTLMASLLLDLFEKITDNASRGNQLGASHVNGALALVKLRGLEQFQDPSEFSIFVRLSTHYIRGCVTSGSPVPDILNTIQAFIGRRIDVQDPGLRLPNLMVQYANLCSCVRMNTLSSNDRIRLSAELDGKLRTLDLELPPSWGFSTIPLDHKTARTFDLYVDSYANPRVCQARNMLRVFRILLNESLIEQYMASPTSDGNSALLTKAYDHIRKLSGEICASVPQYLDCYDTARQRLPISKNWESSVQTSNPGLDHGPWKSSHLHTPNHQLYCYTLVFPLYVAGRCKVFQDVRVWVIEQLRYIGSHFCVRNAEVVTQVLERESDANPWEIYARLGSYAFAS